MPLIQRVAAVCASSTLCPMTSTPRRCARSTNALICSRTCGVPESAVNLQLPGVRYHTLRSAEAKVDLSCVYRADNASPALMGFLDIVRKVRSRKIKLVTE